MVKGLVFFDLDGTLLNDKSQIDADVVEAIAKLKQNNYVPIVATGRTIVEIEHILKEAGIDSIISMNGQHGVYNGKEVYDKQIPKDSIRRLKERVLSNRQQIAFYNPGKIRITGHSYMAEKCFEYVNGELPLIDGQMYEKEPINMLLVLTDTGDDEYRDEFPEFNFVRNSPFSIDVFEEDVSKAEGIKIFIKELQFEDLPTYAFGDGLNDMEMFEIVDYPIAMENAVDALKEKAVHITKSNLNQGIELGLKHYNLI